MILDVIKNNLQYVGRYIRTRQTSSDLMLHKYGQSDSSRLINQQTNNQHPNCKIHSPYFVIEQQLTRNN